MLVSHIQPPHRLLGDVLMSKVCLLNIRFFHLSRISRKEMFSQRFSPTTGKMEWVVEDEDYDMRDEIARWSLDLKYSRGVCITICLILLCDFLFHSQVSLYRHASRWWKGRKSLMICDRLPKCICKFRHMTWYSVCQFLTRSLMNFPVEDKATGYAMEISQLFDSSDLAAILY